MTAINLADTFIALANRYPDSVAIETSEKSVTFRQLVVRASATAGWLHERGVCDGVRVGIVTRDNAHAFVTMLAIWMAGAVAVPIDFRTKLKRIAELARDFEISHVISDKLIGDGTTYESLVIEDYLAGRSDTGSWPVTPKEHVDESVPALIVLTSGTTGRPAGVVMDHDRLFFRVLHPYELGIMDGGGKLLCPIPISFALALHNILGHMIHGGSVRFMPALFSISELSEAIAASDISSVCVVPTLARGLLELHADDEGPVFPGLNLFYCAGSQFGESEKRQLLSRLTPNLVEVLANSVSGRLTLLAGGDLDTHAATVGRVLPQVLLQIVDRNKRPVDNGTDGLIRVRSPGMARRLIGVPDDKDTGDRISDGWVYTGDLGRLDSEGFLTLVGRDSEVIIRNGENIQPAEIEKILMEVRGVKEVAVIGTPSEGEGENIVAFVVADAEVTESHLSAAARRELVPNKNPSVYRFMSELPKNVNGKVMKSQLRDAM